jgi:hypothetical protein
MPGQSGYSRATSANVGEIERRLRSIEQRLERAGATAPPQAQTADHVGETIASALSSIADRFRGGRQFHKRRSGETRQWGGEAW